MEMSAKQECARPGGLLTERRMLKCKCDDILNPLDWVRGRVPGKPFADEHLDPSQVVIRAPVVLEEQLATERRKLQLLEFALLCHFWWHG